jgi:RND family efflux transporter MFP subunit
VSGFLETVDFTEGDLVQKGALLFTIERAPYVAARSMAKAELSSANATDALNSEVLGKYQTAYDQGAATEVELLEAKAKVDVSAASVEAAQANLDKAELDLSYTQIQSPINGQISRLLVNAGNLVGTGTDGILTTVTSIDPMHVYFNVRESELLKFQRLLRDQGIQDGRGLVPIQLILPDGTKYDQKGHVDFVDSVVNPNTGTIDVRGAIPNPEGILKPGLFVRVEITSTPQTGLMIPEVAVMRDMAGDYVLIIDEKNIVSRQGVSIGDVSKHLVEITDGLATDDLVIVDGLLVSRPGNPVNATTKTIDEAMEKIDPSAIADAAKKASRAAFEKMVKERYGRTLPPERTTARDDAANSNTNETGT